VKSPDGKHSLNIGEQTATVLHKIKAIINEATGGAHSLENVIDAIVFLTDMKDYAGMVTEWNKVWPDKQNALARAYVQAAALPNERLHVEFKCTAVVG
jgi:2-aminomuconate deaminase